MSLLSLSDGTSLIEINLVQWDGDAYISISVNSRGFAGRNDLHIASDGFIGFCKGLLEAQRTLKSKASLASIHPSELELSVRPADGLGHYEVVGSTGYHVQVAHTSYWHEVHFGFQIEPSQLDAAVRVSWVREYGGGSGA